MQFIIINLHISEFLRIFASDFGKNSNDNGSRDPLNDLLNEPLNTERIASLLKIPYSTTKRIIKELEQQGRIIRIGSKKTGHWEIIEK